MQVLPTQEEWQEMMPQEVIVQEEVALHERPLEEETRVGVYVPTTTPSFTASFEGTRAALSPVSDTASEADAPLVVREGWRKVMPYTFTRQQEGDLEEWLQQNAILYDKENEGYRDRDKNGMLAIHCPTCVLKVPSFVKAQRHSLPVIWCTGTVHHIISIHPLTPLLVLPHHSCTSPSAVLKRLLKQKGDCKQQ